jgi:hypothetical protein
MLNVCKNTWKYVNTSAAQINKFCVILRWTISKFYHLKPDCYKVIELWPRSWKRTFSNLFSLLSQMLAIKSSGLIFSRKKSFTAKFSRTLDIQTFPSNFIWNSKYELRGHTSTEPLEVLDRQGIFGCIGVTLGSGYPDTDQKLRFFQNT